MSQNCKRQNEYLWHTVLFHLDTCRVDQLLWSMTALLPNDGGNNTPTINFNFWRNVPQHGCMPNGVWLNIFLSAFKLIHPCGLHIEAPQRSVCQTVDLLLYNFDVLIVFLYLEREICLATEHDSSVYEIKWHSPVFWQKLWWICSPNRNRF